MSTCPKCGAKAGLSLNDGKPPRQWSCGSGWAEARIAAYRKTEGLATK